MNHIIVHLEIPADDLQRAVNFYRELFGWKIESMSEFPDYPMFSPSEDEKDLRGAFTKREQPEQRPLPYILVESIEEYSEKIQALGGKILAPKMPVPGMGWLALFQDPENNILGLWTPDPNAA